MRGTLATFFVLGAIAAFAQTPAVTGESSLAAADKLPAAAAAKAAVWRHKLDSLGTDTLTEKSKALARLYRHKIDSTQRASLGAVRAAENKITKDVQAAERKLTGSVTGAEQKVLQAGGAENLKPNLPNVNLPQATLPQATLPQSAVPSLPSGGLPAVPSGALPSVPGAGAVQQDISKVTSLPQQEIGTLKNTGELKDVTKDLGEAKQLSGRASGYGKDISGVVKGDSQSVAKLEKRIESEAAGNSAVKNLSAQNPQLDQAKQLATQAENPEALEKTALEDAKKQAVNHFAGKEQVLKSAMDKVSALKRKYPNLSSLNNIPKHVPNEMHGKPFIERLLPGVNYQILKTDSRYRVDVNPYLGYRLTGHITLGAGWNERVSFRHFHFAGRQRVYGPRLFGEYRLPKGYWARVELETMNAYIPPNQSFGDPRQREWVWASFAGLKKRFKLYKFIYGTTQITYNLNSLFDKHHINLYPDPLAARIGFEFPLAKRNAAQVK